MGDPHVIQEVSHVCKIEAKRSIEIIYLNTFSDDSRIISWG